MSIMTDPIDRFVHTMVECQAAFEQVKLEIDHKSSQVELCIKNFQKSIAQAMAVKIETDDDELRQLYEGARESLSGLLQAVADDIERSKKGTEFIKRYEQSFNVAVFGKVKAGKSYLGNFIMGSYFRDLGIETAYSDLPQPQVEVYDRGKVSVHDQIATFQEEGANGFVVDANEATSAIQLFHLGGLTWFDTPGIGSVTWENEMLAKDYVDNADLVIYTSNSDAAGTRQDFAEMGELYRKGKQFLLLLTQSDTLEEYVEDETGEIYSSLVAKSEKDRYDTEAYMLSTLEGAGLPRLRQDEILTISAKLAIMALEEGDEAKFRDSHMGDLLDILTSITRTDGARLKRETPAKRVRTAVIDFLDRLDSAEQEFDRYQKDLKKKQNELNTRSDALLEEMKAQCRNRIDTLIRQKAMDVDKKGGAVSADELSKLVSGEIHEVLLHTCAGEFAASGKIVSDYADSIRVEDIGDLEMKTDSIKYTITEVRQVSRDPEGIFEHIGSFFGKEYHKTVTRDKEMESIVDLGVNDQQILSITHGQLDKLFDTEVPQLMKKISGQYLNEVTTLLNASVKCIKDARQELETLKCEL